MIQTVPNSHSWTSIKMLLHWLSHFKGEKVDVDYLIVGLNNTLERGYELASPAPIEDNTQSSQPDKGEGQEEIWNELKDYVNIKMDQGTFLTDNEWTVFIHLASPQFTISRKQK